MIEVTDKNSKDTPEREWWQPALLMFFKFSGLIIAPLLLGTLLGRYLDKKYDTEPWLFLLVSILSFIVSMAILVVNVTKDFKKFGKKDSKEI